MGSTSEVVLVGNCYVVVYNKMHMMNHYHWYNSVIALYACIHCVVR